MPLHTGLVNRASAVLVIVDVQERLAAVMERRKEAVGSIVRLARVAALTGMPIIATLQNPAGLGDLVPELASALGALTGPSAVTVVDKMSFSACDEAGFMEAVRRTGRSQVVLSGMETHICVAQTAIGLVEEGLLVHVVADACCSRRFGDHQIALDRMRAEGIVVTTSESAMYEAVSRAGTDEFRQLLAIVKQG